MSEENKYCEASIQPIKNPIEHIRKRPSMYIGRVDQLGNLFIVSGLFEYIETEMNWTKAVFTYLENDSFQIVWNEALNFELTTENIVAANYQLNVILGLSETCTIHSNEKELYYEKGELISENRILKVDELSITFKFDNTILHNKKLPEYLLFNFFKRYTFLYPEKEINVFENEENIANFSSNGLEDWFAMKSFESKLFMKPFQFFVEDKIIDLKAEIMFSIHDGKETFSTITLPRADFIRENGTHATGFLKGLNATINEILGETKRKFEFSEYRNVIGVFKLSYPNLEFYGPTRNEVGSEELVEVFENATQEALLANGNFRQTIMELFGS
jgi:DNA gyrase/topoisomerase IV subunit B